MAEGTVSWHETTRNFPSSIVAPIRVVLGVEIQENKEQNIEEWAVMMKTRMGKEARDGRRKKEDEETGR